MTVAFEGSGHYTFLPKSFVSKIYENCNDPSLCYIPHDTHPNPEAG
jgi:hypothetical protein